MIKSKHRVLLIFIAVLLVMSLPTVIVLGDTWGHRTTITLNDTLGTLRTNVPIILDTIKGQNLINAGFVNINATDTRMAEGTYGKPFLVCDDKILFVATNLSAYQEKTYYFYMGYQPVLDSFPIITGYNGSVTVPDNNVTEPDDAYVFGIVGYFDTSAGANKDIIRKDGAVVFNVTNDKELTFAITGGNSLVASNVTSGEHTIMIYSDGSDLWMTIDDVEQDRVTASAIPDTNNAWFLFENNVCPYVYYFGEWVVS